MGTGHGTRLSGLRKQSGLYQTPRPCLAPLWQRRDWTLGEVGCVWGGGEEGRGESEHKVRRGEKGI